MWILHRPGGKGLCAHNLVNVKRLSPSQNNERSWCVLAKLDGLDSYVELHNFKTLEDAEDGVEAIAANLAAGADYYRMEE